MPEKYAPKHRGAPPKHRGNPPQRVRTGAKNAVLYSGVAVFATSLSVGAGITAGKSQGSSAGESINLSGGRSQLSAADLSARDQQAASRSSARTQAPARQVATLKAAELGTGSAVAVPRTENLSLTDPKALTRALMPRYGLSSSEFDCLDEIWTQESNWNVHADNPHSSAYGIPQALPGSKMSSEGADWRNNPETQIRWGLGYIKNRYGTACSAWSFKRSHGYY